MKQLCALAVVVLLSGCTLQSTQWNAISSVFSNKSVVGEQWLLRYEGLESRVVPVAVDSLIVFGNADDIAVVFDGWTITAVVGFGPARKIRALVNDRIYSRGADTTSHRCSELLNTGMASGSIWRQRCETEFSYENRITLDSQGRIISIDQVVDASGTRLNLKKL